MTGQVSAEQLPAAITDDPATLSADPVPPPAPAAAVAGLAKTKKRVFELLEVAAPGDRASAVVDGILMTLIVASVAAFVLETVPSLLRSATRLFLFIELATLVIFSAEYLLRIWSCTSHPKYREPLRGRLRYAATPLVLVDLAAVLPLWLTFGGLNLQYVRLLRLFRLLRIAKFARYSAALQLMGRVFLRKKEELLSTLGLLLMLLLFASSLIYFLEHDAQPEEFSSIPATMWWGVATLTTVGYGDLCPVTPAGRLLASVIAVLGIGLFALPAGLLGAAFLEERESRVAPPCTCPHCGETLGRGPLSHQATAAKNRSDGPTSGP